MIGFQLLVAIRADTLMAGKTKRQIQAANFTLELLDGALEDHSRLFAAETTYYYVIRAHSLAEIMVHCTIICRRVALTAHVFYITMYVAIYTHNNKNPTGTKSLLLPSYI